MYRWVDHTAELELQIEAPTEEAVFAEALEAFSELVGDDRRADSHRREIELRAHDREELLASWLDELVYLADVAQFVPEHVSDLELGAGRLRATVRGHRGEPRPLVKAVTRHGLALRPAHDGGWHARVVLDV